MTPHQRIQKLPGEVPGYEAADIVGLLPLSAALQTRVLITQQQARMPSTDFLLSTEAVATRLGKSAKRVRDSVADLHFAIRVCKEHRFSVPGPEEWIAKQRAAKMALALPPMGRQL